MWFINGFGLNAYKSVRTVKGFVLQLLDIGFTLEVKILISVTSILHQQTEEVLWTH